MSSKKFDAVEMKRRGAEQIYQRTKNMSPAQELAYWLQRGADFRNEQSRIVRRAKSKRRAG